MTTLIADQVRTEHIPVEEIVGSDKFNHRKEIKLHQVMTLAASIKEKGLMTPLLIRELKPGRASSFGAESDNFFIQQGFKYRVVAGHRRLRAIKHLYKKEGKPSTIECKIYSADQLDAGDELDLNVMENFERTEITPYEECIIVEKYQRAGYSANEIAEKIDRPPQWVKLRIQINGCHDKVKELLHEGKIKISDFDAILKEDDPIKQALLAAEIRDARDENRSVAGLLANRKQTVKKDEAKARNPHEILRMADHLREVFGKQYTKMQMHVECWDIFSPQGNSIATKTLAWAGGHISNGEMYGEIQKLCEKMELNYDPPEFE